MNTEKVVLAGGCFWGMQDLIRKQPGVVKTRVGYTGGTTAHPTYDDVKKGNSGHAEAIEIEFSPDQLSFSDLLRFFFKIHNPTTLNRQGNDIGTQYRSAIFFQNDRQKEVAAQIIDEVRASGKWKGDITTSIEASSEFFEAEAVHQDYLEKNPGGYSCHFVRD